MTDGTLDAMTRYGGGFVKALAACFRVADESNRAKLFVAFERTFNEYKEMARLINKPLVTPPVRADRQETEQK